MARQQQDTQHALFPQWLLIKPGQSIAVPTSFPDVHSPSGAGSGGSASSFLKQAVNSPTSVAACFLSQWFPSRREIKWSFALIIFLAFAAGLFAAPTPQIRSLDTPALSQAYTTSKLHLVYLSPTGPLRETMPYLRRVPVSRQGFLQKMFGKQS